MERQIWEPIMYKLGIKRGKLRMMSENEFNEAKRFAYEAGLSPMNTNNFTRNFPIIEDPLREKRRRFIKDQDNEYVKAEKEQIAIQNDEDKRKKRLKYLFGKMEETIRECSKIGENKKAKIKVLIKFPNNSKLLKRFNSSSLSNDVYLCALSNKESWNKDSTEKKIKIRDPLGKVINNSKSFRELGITKPTVLTVEYD